MKGIVLAGGRSSRYGSDKALAVYEGRRFVERAVAALDALSTRPAVITRRKTAYAFLGCACVEDKLPDLGPLGGLYTAMTTFPHERFLVLGCDMPRLGAEALRLLVAGASASDDATVFVRPEGTEPLPGIYARTLLGRIRRSLIEGGLSLQGLLAGSRVRRVRWTRGPEAFLNVNRPAEIAP